MAKLAGDDLYDVVTDHIGTPRELVSEDDKRTAWRAKFGLWGNTEKIDIWRSEVANGEDVTCQIRFQGQWADEESGLHYNRFRYYDAEAGPLSISTTTGAITRACKTSPRPTSTSDGAKQSCNKEKGSNERPSKRGACFTASPPRNQTKQMSQTLS